MINSYAAARPDCTVDGGISPAYVRDAFVRSSIRSFVCYQTCEHSICKTNEPILIWCHKWSTGQGRETINFGVGGQKVQGHMKPK